MSAPVVFTAPAIWKIPLLITRCSTRREFVRIGSSGDRDLKTPALRWPDHPTTRFWIRPLFDHVLNLLPIHRRDDSAANNYAQSDQSPEEVRSSVGSRHAADRAIRHTACRPHASYAH